MSKPLRILVVFLTFACSAPMAPVVAGMTASSARPLSEFRREQIAVETHSARRHLFDAWRADSPEMREQGLMFVREMRDDEAMIFVYDPPEQVEMWMKNTLLSLDMLFVDRHGCIVTIKERARPGSLDTIESRYPVALVVEVLAGTVATRGIRIGDRVVRPDAGWPAQATPCTAAH